MKKKEVSGYLAKIPPCLGMYRVNITQQINTFQFKFEPGELSEAKPFSSIFILYSFWELKLLKRISCFICNHLRTYHGKAVKSTIGVPISTIFKMDRAGWELVWHLRGFSKLFPSCTWWNMAKQMESWWFISM